MISIYLPRILILVLFFGLVACNSDEYDRALKEKQDLTQELALLRKDQEDLKGTVNEMSRSVSDFERLQKKEAQILIEFNEVKSYLDELNAGLSYVDSKVDTWLPATRNSLIGVKLGLVRIPNGKVYTDATIVSLSGEKVEIKHQNGQDVIDLEKFPEDLRKKLIHEPTLALEITLN